MKYFAKIKKERDGTYTVEFPDVPGCLTEGKSFQEAICNAKEALDGWLAARCDRSLKIPVTKKRNGKSFHPIEVDLRVEFAIALRQLRNKRKLTQGQVAKKLGISQQAYAKLEAPEKTNPSLETIKRLSDVLDAEINIKLVA